MSGPEFAHNVTGFNGVDFLLVGTTPFENTYGPLPGGQIKFRLLADDGNHPDSGDRMAVRLGPWTARLAAAQGSLN